MQSGSVPFYQTHRDHSRVRVVISREEPDAEARRDQLR
jgi:uncharacterized membrane protein